jgi:stage II sporulation protein AA (anti-sigma F factor antagonist)
MLNLQYEKTNKRLIAKFYGDIDHHTCNNIRDILDSEIEKKQPNILVLDLSNVDFMDSSGIGVIIGRYKKVKAYDGNVYFAGITEKIDKLIKLSGLLTIIEPLKEAK